jgi:Flp pilus assembly protein TadG
VSLKDQRGQGLVETALAAPLVVLLTLGLLQVGQLLWLRVRLQAAAMEAARAYTVWQPSGEAQAQSKARRAAWLALRPQPAVLGFRVDVDPYQARNAFYGDRQDEWLRGTLAHQLRVRLQVPAFPGLHWIWPEGLTLEAPAGILSEDSNARDKAEHAP